MPFDAPFRQVISADGNASLMLFSALSMPPFRTIKLRAKKPTCPACGVDGHRLGVIQETDYIAFCGGPRPDWQARGLMPGKSGERISAQVSCVALRCAHSLDCPKELQERLKSQEQCMLLDVRPKTEFGICHLPGSLSKTFRHPSYIIHKPHIGVPLPQLLANPSPHLQPNAPSEIVVLCRLGNDSQIAAEALRELDLSLDVKDVIGGLRAWAKYVDPQFPVY